MSSPDSIYIRLPNWIGDVCMSLPLLAALDTAGIGVHVCARPWAADLLAGMPMRSFLPMSGRLWTDRATVARHRSSHDRHSPGLLLPDSFSSAAVFRFAGVASAGWRDDGRRALLRWPFDKPSTPTHAVESWYRLGCLAVNAWSGQALADRPAERLNLRLTDQARAQAQCVLEDAGLADQPFVLIAPTATGLHKGKMKVWPHFAELTDRLEQHGLAVAYCVPPSEADQARRHAPGARALPPLPLGAFAALTQAAQLVVCNDSGVSHLAAEAGARQLTLFGVTSPARTGPWSPDAHCLGESGQWPAVIEVVQTALDISTRKTERPD